MAGDPTVQDKQSTVAWDVCSTNPDRCVSESDPFLAEDPQSLPEASTVAVESGFTPAASETNPIEGASVPKRVGCEAMFASDQPEVQLTKSERQMITLSESLLKDDIAYIEMLCAELDDVSVEMLEELKITTVAELLDLIAKAKCGNPINLKNLKERVLKLHGRLALLKDAVDSLDFVHPSKVTYTTTMDDHGRSIGIERLVQEIIGVILDNDIPLDEIEWKVDILRKYSEHVKQKLAMAGLLRSIAPLPIKDGSFTFRTDYSATCDYGDSDPFYVSGEFPCDYVTDHPFYKALEEMPDDERAKFEKAFQAIFGIMGIDLLVSSEIDYESLDQLVDTEALEISSGDIKSFIQRVIEIQNKESGVDDYAELIQDSSAHASEIGGLQQGYAAIDHVLENGTSEEIEGALDETFKILEGQVSDIDEQASSMIFDDFDQHATDIFMRLCGGHAEINGVALGDGDSGGSGGIQDTLVNSEKRFLVDDFVGNWGDDDAPHTYEGEITKFGYAHALNYTIRGIKDDIQEVKADDTLTSAEKLQELRSLIYQLQNCKFTMLKLQLAYQLKGMSDEALEYPNVAESIEFFANCSQGGLIPERLVEETQKLQNAIVKDSLSHAIDQEIANIEYLKDKSDDPVLGIFDIYSSPKGFDNMIAKLEEARSKLEAGDLEGARSIYLSCIYSPNYSNLRARYLNREGAQQVAVDYLINVAIVIASAGIGSLASTAVKGAGSMLQLGRLGRAALWVGELIAEGTAFYVSQNTLESMIYGEGHGWSAEDADHDTGLAMMILMFAFLKGGGKVFRALARSKVVKGFEKRLTQVRGHAVKLTAAEGEAVFQAWIKHASRFRRILNQTAYYGGEFAFENMTFTAWNIIHGSLESGGDVAGAFESATSTEAIHSQLAFLCFLRMGNMMARPLISKASGGVERLVMGKKGTEYNALQAEGQEILAKMEAYYAELQLKPETVDMGKMDLLLAEYVAHSQKRLSFLRGLPDYAVDVTDVKAAEADITAAESLAEAKGDLNNFALKPVGRGVYVADAKQIRQILKGAKGVTSEGNGVYRVETEGDPIYIIEEAGPAKPGRVETAIQDAKERLEEEVIKRTPTLVLEKAPGVIGWLNQHAPIVALGIDMILGGGGFSGGAGAAQMKAGAGWLLSPEVMKDISPKKGEPPREPVDVGKNGVRIYDYGNGTYSLRPTNGESPQDICTEFRAILVASGESSVDVYYDLPSKGHKQVQKIVDSLGMEVRIHDINDGKTYTFRPERGVTTSDITLGEGFYGDRILIEKSDKGLQVEVDPGFKADDLVALLELHTAHMGEKPLIRLSFIGPVDAEMLNMLRSRLVRSDAEVLVESQSSGGKAEPLFEKVKIAGTYPAAELSSYGVRGQAYDVYDSTGTKKICRIFNENGKRVISVRGDYINGDAVFVDSVKSIFQSGVNFEVRIESGEVVLSVDHANKTVRVNPQSKGGEALFDAVASLKSTMTHNGKGWTVEFTSSNNGPDKYTDFIMDLYSGSSAITRIREICKDGVVEYIYNPVSGVKVSGPFTEVAQGVLVEAGSRKLAESGQVTQAEAKTLLERAMTRVKLNGFGNYKRYSEAGWSALWQSAVEKMANYSPTSKQPSLKRIFELIGEKSGTVEAGQDNSIELIRIFAETPSNTLGLRMKEADAIWSTYGVEIEGSVLQMIYRQYDHSAKAYERRSAEHEEWVLMNIVAHILEVPGGVSGVKIYLIPTKHRSGSGKGCTPDFALIVNGKAYLIDAKSGRSIDSSDLEKGARQVVSPTGKIKDYIESEGAKLSGGYVWYGIYNGANRMESDALFKVDISNGIASEISSDNFGPEMISYDASGM
ncbi:MAG: hypothetical protein HN337_01210 [Deltaproteobacteria bacterium]|nr:hypothetical protein [Deltaproteobacteria bacterium]